LGGAVKLRTGARTAEIWNPESGAYEGFEVSPEQMSAWRAARSAGASVRENALAEYGEADEIRELRVLFEALDGKTVGEAVVHLDDLVAEAAKGEADWMFRANLEALDIARKAAALRGGKIYVEGTEALVEAAKRLGFEPYDRAIPAGRSPIVVASRESILKRGLETGEGVFVIRRQEPEKARKLIAELFVALGLSALRGKEDAVDGRVVRLIAREKQRICRPNGSAVTRNAWLSSLPSARGGGPSTCEKSSATRRIITCADS